MRRILIVWFLIFCSSVNANDYEDILTQYQSLIPPNNINTPSRNGYSLGAYSARYPIVSAQNIVSLQTPSLKAGCGGIDVFGGSFSMINKDQAVALMRAIIASASGYAMQLALEGLCPTCNQIMTGLKRTIDQLNKMAKDSCAAAKWAINQTQLDDWSKTRVSTAKKTQEISAKQAEQHRLETKGAEAGLFSGFMDGVTKIAEGQSAWDLTDVLNDKHEIVGSTIYDALTISGQINGNTAIYQPLAVLDEFKAGSTIWNSREIIELIVALYGYAGYKDDRNEDPNSKQKKTVSDDIVKLSARDLMFGIENYKMPECNDWSAVLDSEKCDHPSNGSTGVDYEGISTKVKKAFFGEIGVSVGIATKLDLMNVNDIQDAFTPEQELLWNSIPKSKRDLMSSLKGKEQAEILLKKSYSDIAIELLKASLNTFETSIESSLQELSKDGESGHFEKIKAYSEVYYRNKKDFYSELSNIKRELDNEIEHDFQILMLIGQL